MIIIEETVGVLALSMDLVELKSKIIELLKRDEDFRYMVAGLIGLDKILEELKKLHENFNKLYEKSLEHDKRFEEINRRFEAIEKRFEEVNKRFEDINKRFEEINKRFETIDKRFEEIEKRFEEINRRFEEINKRFEAIDKRFEEINKRFLEIEKRFEAIERRFEVIEKKLLEHDKKFEELVKRIDRVEKRVSHIEYELGALNEAFYCKALWDDLREILVANGEKLLVRRRNAVVDDEEIDLLVVTDKRVYVVEAKVKPRYEDVGRLSAKIDVVKKHYADKEIVGILAGSKIGREIEEYAENKGFMVYQY